MDPSDLENGPVELGDAIRESLQPEGNTPTDPKLSAEPGVLPEEPAWEAPDWAKRWKPEARDALGRFATHAELKRSYEALRPQLEEMNGYTTRRDQEYADYRKRFDPISQVLSPYEQRYALRGIPIQQGLQQLFSAAELLNTDPDQAFPWLAGQHRPRDPMAAINQLARSWGVDLGQLSADQPYMDPQVSALLNPLQQQVQQLTQLYTQSQTQAVQQQQQALVAEISDFEAAKDDNGASLHPHFGAVFDDMVQLVQMGRATDIASAYALAVRLNPDLQQQAVRELEDKARKKALDEAAARTVAAEKSEKASRSVKGKGQTSNTGANAPLSFREGYDKAVGSLGG